jgi:hypothetical protein
VTENSSNANRRNGAPGPRLHPRTVGWFGTTAVAMGGINQSLFLLSALFIGQGAIPGRAAPQWYCSASACS